MQISAHTVLASQQQAARPQKPAVAPFEPPEFETAARAGESQGAELPAPTGYVRPGTHIDIKV